MTAKIRLLWMGGLCSIALHWCALDAMRGGTVAGADGSLVLQAQLQTPRETYRTPDIPEEHVRATSPAPSSVDADVREFEATLVEGLRSRRVIVSDASVPVRDSNEPTPVLFRPLSAEESEALTRINLAHGLAQRGITVGERLLFEVRRSDGEGFTATILSVPQNPQAADSIRNALLDLLRSDSELWLMGTHSLLSLEFVP